MNKKETEKYYQMNETGEVKPELTWDFVLEQLDKKRWENTGNPKSYFNKLNEQVKRKGRLT